MSQPMVGVQDLLQVIRHGTYCTHSPWCTSTSPRVGTMVWASIHHGSNTVNASMLHANFIPTIACWIQNAALLDLCAVFPSMRRCPGPLHPCNLLPYQPGDPCLHSLVACDQIGPCWLDIRHTGARLQVAWTLVPPLPSLSWPKVQRGI